MSDGERPCRFGYTEYDGARYCHEHGDFLEPGVQSLRCGTARRAALSGDAVPRTDAKKARECLTCNGWNPVTGLCRRETKGLVCQTCGWDYGRDGEP